MRCLFVISLVLFVSLSSFGQRKNKVDPKDLQISSFGQRKNKVDPKDLQIDSLTQVSSVLTLQLDSVSADVNKYLGVYTTLIDKVFHYEFDPSKTSFLIDSLRTTRDSTFTLATTVLQDSLLLIMNENISLQAILDSLSLVLDETSTLESSKEEKDEAIEELKQLKELLDSEIISQDEFNSKKIKLLEKL